MTSFAENSVSGRETALAIKTYEDLRALCSENDCENPAFRYPDHAAEIMAWTGTALDVLRTDWVLSSHRLFVVLRDGWIPDRTLDQFAWWCRERASSHLKKHDLQHMASHFGLDCIGALDAWVAGEIARKIERFAGYVAEESAHKPFDESTRDEVEELAELAGMVRWASEAKVQVAHLIHLLEELQSPSI